MVERLFSPEKVKRVLESWIGAAIDRYVEWLVERRYSPSSIPDRIPLLIHFGEFARRRGARRLKDLPSYVDPFAVYWNRRSQRRGPSGRRFAAQFARTAVQQMLRLVVPNFRGRECRSALPWPFLKQAPGLRAYLEEERGLSRETIRLHRHYLGQFERHLTDVGVTTLAALSPARLRDFIVERSRQVSPKSLTGCAAAIRGFLRFARREGLVASDLARSVDHPQAYRLATIPRSISWDQAADVLQAVDRSRATGKRDYAILMLLLAYGLRAREAAALTLDDLDWKRDRLRVSKRKGGHSHVYPLTASVGEALLDYIRDARPSSTHRHVFLQVKAPFGPLQFYDVSHRVGSYIKAAGVKVRRAGSHTLRHTCVQRLVDTGFSLKSIGDFVGHRLPESTLIYGKVAIEPLRQVALARGEGAL